MLQALLIAVIGAEIILYFWVANAMSARGFGGLAIAAMIFLIAFLWRLSHSAGSFMVSGFFRLIQVRRDVGLARAFIGEFYARLCSFNIAQPLAQWVMPPEPMVRADTLPVLLVHGYFSNRGMWTQFVKRLNNANVGPVFTVTLTPPFAAIETFALQVHQRVEAICSATGQKEVIVIAHSMGGLVMRNYMVTQGCARIAKLITLGSPHHGTRLAHMGMGKCASQMRLNGKWIASLIEKEKSRPKPMTISIYSINDDLAYPPDSARLGWAENIEVNRVGHVGLLFSREIAQLVITELLLFRDQQKKKA